MRRLLFVQSYGLFDLRCSFSPFITERIDPRPDGHVTIARAGRTIELIEHARVGGTEHACSVLFRGEPGKSAPRPLVSSVANPYREDATPDFAPHVESLFSPESAVVIGHCLGAGLSRVAALPLRIRARTVVVSGQNVVTTEARPYKELGVYDCVPRLKIIDTLFGLLDEPDCGLEYGGCARLPVGEPVVRL